MATQPSMATGAPGAAHPFDGALWRRIDCIILQLEASPPKTIGRAWWRLQKAIAERHVPAFYPEVR